MESIERVKKVLRGELPDRVPVGLHCYLLACRMQGGGLMRFFAVGNCRRRRN